MEREDLLVVLSFAIFAFAVTVGASLSAWLSPGRFPLDERKAWWSLVAPVAVGLTGVCFAVGWALQEPDPANEGPNSFIWVAGAWTIAVLARSLWRGFRTIRANRTMDELSAPIVTFGIFRRSTVVSRSFREEAAPAVLQAALAHERAHARGYDPLRILVARFVADMQWPFSVASRRLKAWQTALEVRRDRDAVVGGADATALAEAIVLAARLQTTHAQRLGAEAAGDGRPVG